MQTDQHTPNRQMVADGDYSSIANCQTKFTGLFRGIFGILFKNCCSYIQRILVEPLKIFCGTLVVRHCYICLVI